MEKTLLRVYDVSEPYSMSGDCYFVVLPKPINRMDGEDLFRYLARISGMRWQHYTHYAIGTADVQENELFWCEIVNYETHEVKINVNRVKDIQCYELPGELTYCEF